MSTIIALIISLSHAQMTQEQILNQLVTHINQNKMSQNTVCDSIPKSKQADCLKKQIWLDLNSDTMDAKHSHTKPVHATLYKNLQNNSHPCAIEMVVDPIKKTVSQKNTDWKCWTTDGAQKSSTSP